MFLIREDKRHACTFLSKNPRFASMCGDFLLRTKKHQLKRLGSLVLNEAPLLLISPVHICKPACIVVTISNDLPLGLITGTVTHIIADPEDSKARVSSYNTALWNTILQRRICKL